MIHFKNSDECYGNIYHCRDEYIVPCLAYQQFLVVHIITVVIFTFPRSAFAHLGHHDTEVIPDKTSIWGTIFSKTPILESLQGQTIICLDSLYLWRKTNVKKIYEIEKSDHGHGADSHSWTNHVNIAFGSIR